MKSFPMFLKMTGRQVVIVGGGEKAAQKCRMMLKTEAEILVYAPEIEDELRDLVDAGQITWHQGPVAAATLSRAALVFVATGCAGADATCGALAERAGALVNVVDQPDLSSAATPSIVDRDPVVIAIGTEGTAPVLARQIKSRLEAQLESRLGDLAALAGRLRKTAAKRLSPSGRRDLWRWVFDGPIRALHAQGRERDAATRLKTALQTADYDAGATAQVALVGAGPGSRDLITLRGVQRLQDADIVFYDRLVDPGLLDLARPDAERVFVGKRPGCRAWPQDRINAVLVSAARQGKRVVRLKCGDPGVFARGAEEAEALTAAGFEFEIVPGVTAASAAAAAAGDFLTERGKTDTLVLTTGRKTNPGDMADWVDLLTADTNVCIYMGVGACQQIQDTLTQRGLAQATRVKIVSHAGMASQRILGCAGDALAETIRTQDVANPAILFLTLDGAQTKRSAPQADPYLRVISA